MLSGAVLGLSANHPVGVLMRLGVISRILDEVVSKVYHPLSVFVAGSVLSFRSASRAGFNNLEGHR